MNIRFAALPLVCLGAVGCQDKPTAKPEPTPPTVAQTAPAPAVSASAAPIVPAKPWRITPKERFAELKKKCETGSVEACAEAIAIDVEAKTLFVSPPMEKAHAEFVAEVIKQGCKQGSKLACAKQDATPPKGAEISGSPAWHKWTLDVCTKGGDVACFGLRQGAQVGDAKASTAACDKGIGTECLVLAHAAIRDAKYPDQLKYAKLACDAYLPTCFQALEVITRGHADGYASADARPLVERLAAEQPKRCAEGYPTCGQAALAYLELGKDIAEVRKYAEAGVEDRDQLAHYVLARLADEGKGEPVDAAKAAKLYVKCRDLTRRHEGVCAGRLAQMYEEGVGVTKDLEAAMNFARYAVDLQSVRRATPTVYRLVRLVATQKSPPAKNSLLELAKQECDAERDPQCKVLWKLVEEGKPIQEPAPAK